MTREICQLCHFHEAYGSYRIKDSHVLEKYEHKMWLCKWCYEDLRSLNVRIERVAPTYEAQPKRDVRGRVLAVLG